MTKLTNTINNKLAVWAQSHIANLFIFNLLLLLLLLLHSIGYFDPFLKITASFIIVFAMIASVVLLGLKTQGMIVITLIFWGITLAFKLLGIDIWAERLGVYTFYSLLLSIILFIIEAFKNKK